MMSLTSSPRRNLAVLTVFVTVAVILPVAVTALMLWSFLGRSTALSAIPVAVVNQDQPATVGDGDSARTIAAGRQLAANLTDPQQPGQYDLDWVLTDSQDATDGLVDGRYYAVVTIPESFSSAITSTSGDTPVQAQLTVDTNDASNRLAGAISEQVAAAAADDLGAQASASYLDNLFLGFNTISEQMTAAAGSAGELSAGATDLAFSSGSVDDGARSLQQSMLTLQQGADSVASGASALAGGSAAVADGASQTATAAAATADATVAVARGASVASEGSARLGTSALALADSAAALADSCPATAGIEYCAQVRELAVKSKAQERATTGLARGQSELADVSSQAATASEAVSAASSNVAAGTVTVAQNAGALNDGAAGVSTGTQSASAGATQLAAGTAALNEGSGSLASGAQTLASSLADGAEAVPTYSDSESQTLQTVVTEPVVVTSEKSNTTGLKAWPAALIAATVLWLGAIAATHLRRTTLLFNGAVPARSIARTALSTLSPVAAASLTQAVAVWVTMLCFGLPTTAAAAAGAVSLLASVAFTAIVVAFRSLSPRYGVLIAIAAFAGQLVCAGGLLPIQTAPAVLQTINPMLPLTAFGNALATLISTGSSSTSMASVATLLGWAAAAAAVTAFIGRRRATRHATSVPGTPTILAIEAPTRYALGAR